MDIGGRTAAALIPHDSNPGVVTLTPGGVGYNIARNLRLLDADTAMLTALGEDAFADALRRDALERGLDLSLSAAVHGGRTSTYLYLLEGGDMVAAINDMAVCESITPELLSSRLDAIRRFDMLVVDGNLPEASIRWLCQHCDAPIIADPVSAVKAGKFRHVLGRLYAMKPNAMEAELLTGVAVTDETSARSAAQALLDTGMRQVYISMGAAGIYARARDGAQARFPCPRVTVTDATGGGDAMVAALCATLLRGGSLSDAARNAICAGAFACTAAGAVHPAMSWAAIEKISESEELS